MFSGEISDWSALGGNSESVNVYAREKNSGTWDTFKSLVLKPNKASLSSAALRFESSSKLSDKVSIDPGGIGFIALPYVRYSKLLAISEGDNTMPIVPTAFTIGTEDYPLSRRLYLYAPQQASVDVKSFVEFVHSKEGQDVVEKHGFVSQNIYAIKPFQDKSYPQEYLELTANAQRLSLNHRVYVFGFTDSIGNTKQNLDLSQYRVKTIEQALNARGIFPAISKGLGEAISIASNKTAYGRYKNRRVEVWIE